ncbi:manganese efflux pump [Paenibacillus sp. GCM10027626]|uniref:manganese efflux pump n=1 Tax=Paenibacillus sp. GCM10027626 TaxID=3273411 RepID=UPI00363ECEE3
MASWLIIAALTFSSSVDNLGVGLSYGIRNIRIRLLQNLLIAVICFLFSVCGIYFGLWLSSLLPGLLPVIVGAFILVIIGIRIILLATPRKQSDDGPAEPAAKTIGWGESMALGVALSANALTNGIGAGLLGLSPMLISLLAAIGSFVTVWIGVAFGIRLAHVRIGKYTVGQFGTVISGVLLVVVAALAFLD